MYEILFGQKFPKPAIVESKKLEDSDSVHFLRIGRKLKIYFGITRSLANPADATLFSFFPTTHFHQKVLHILILQCFIQCQLVLFYLVQTSLCPLFRNMYLLKLCFGRSISKFLRYVSTTFEIKLLVPLSICTRFFKIYISRNWFLNLIFCLFWTWFLQAVKIKFEIDKKSSSKINFMKYRFQNQVQIDRQGCRDAGDTSPHLFGR